MAELVTGLRLFGHFLFWIVADFILFICVALIVLTLVYAFVEVLREDFGND